MLLLNIAQLHVGYVSSHNDVQLVQVCDTIAELASGTYEELGWPELLPFIFQCVQSNDARLQESALLIFAQLAHHIMGTLRQYMATLHEVLTRTLQSPNHDVALASMRATAAFVQVRLSLKCHASHRHAGSLKLQSGCNHCPDSSAPELLPSQGLCREPLAPVAPDNVPYNPALLTKISLV